MEKFKENYVSLVRGKEKARMEKQKGTEEYFGKEGTKPKRVAAVRGERPDYDFEHRDMKKTL